VFYGDKNNWWATYAFWVFRLFGAENLKILDGGRLRWADEGRELVTTAATTPRATSRCMSATIPRSARSAPR